MDTEKDGMISSWWSGRCGTVAVGLAVFLLLLGLLAGGCHSGAKSDKEVADSQAVVETEPATEETQATVKAAPKQEPTFPLKAGEEISLFDGKTLGQWKVTDFGGQGDVFVKDGAIYLSMGSYATGVTWTGPVERMNYEITLEAMRVEGNDFFCALTFPVAENPCTLVLGGWGGSVCGLSNIDYYDAANNETTRIMGFEQGKWYHVRLRVVPNRIQAWLDGEELVNVDTTDRKIDIRAEMDLAQPLGIATWITTGAVRNIRLKKLAENAEPAGQM